MTETRQITALAENQVSTKRGFPVYRTNPSVPGTGITTRTKRIHVPGGKAAVIVDNSSGEIKGLGGMGFWWEEEVDTSRFVKLFLDGIKQAADLSKTGMQVFELVYHEMRANPGSDEIKLNQYLAKDHGISDRTYQRGVRELLEKEFLFRSPPPSCRAKHPCWRSAPWTPQPRCSAKRRKSAQGCRGPRLSSAWWERTTGSRKTCGTPPPFSSSPSPRPP